MITATEQGRHLILTIDDVEPIVFDVKPVNTKLGSAMFALWAGVLFGQSEQPLVDAEGMSKLAIGEENWAQVEDLRSDEGNKIINAAFFWNTQGGGIELVNEMLSGGLPKARESLLKNNGLWEEYSLLLTLLDGASGNQTHEPAGTPDTSTPNGTSGNSAIKRLPGNKKSINQNKP